MMVSTGTIDRRLTSGWHCNGNKLESVDYQPD
jgi:hypothetical protein